MSRRGLDYDGPLPLLLWGGGRPERYEPLPPLPTQLERWIALGNTGDGPHGRHGGGRQASVWARGREWTLHEIAKEAGVSRRMIGIRRQAGLDGEDLFKPGRRGCGTRPTEIRIPAFGRDWSFREIADEVGITRDAVATRYSRGVRGEALFAPRSPNDASRHAHRKGVPVGSPEHAGTYRHNGRSWTVTEIAAHAGISVHTVRDRVQRGWPTDRLFEPLVTAQSRAASAFRASVRQRAARENAEKNIAAAQERRAAERDARARAAKRQT